MPTGGEYSGGHEQRSIIYAEPEGPESFEYPQPRFPNEVQIGEPEGPEDFENDDPERTILPPVLACEYELPDDVILDRRHGPPSRYYSDYESHSDYQSDSQESRRHNSRKRSRARRRSRRNSRHRPRDYSRRRRTSASNSDSELSPLYSSLLLESPTMSPPFSVLPPFTIPPPLAHPDSPRLWDSFSYSNESMVSDFGVISNYQHPHVESASSSLADLPSSHDTADRPKFPRLLLQAAVPSSNTSKAVTSTDSIRKCDENDVLPIVPGSPTSLPPPLNSTMQAESLSVSAQHDLEKSNGGPTTPHTTGTENGSIQPPPLPPFPAPSVEDMKESSAIMITEDGITDQLPPPPPSPPLTGWSDSKSLPSASTSRRAPKLPPRRSLSILIPPWPPLPIENGAYATFSTEISSTLPPLPLSPPTGSISASSPQTDCLETIQDGSRTPKEL